MYGIILVGHGSFAEGLLSSVNLILGKQEHVSALIFEENDSSEKLKDKIVLEVESMKELEGVIYLTDLSGGTPFKTCVLISQDMKEGKVIAGTNLPLLIEILMNRESDRIDEIVSIGLSSGKDGIMSFEDRRSKAKDRTSGI